MYQSSQMNDKVDSLSCISDRLGTRVPDNDVDSSSVKKSLEKELETDLLYVSQR